MADNAAEDARQQQEQSGRRAQSEVVGQVGDADDLVRDILRAGFDEDEAAAGEDPHERAVERAAHMQEFVETALSRLRVLEGPEGEKGAEQDRHRLDQFLHHAPPRGAIW